MQHLLNYTHYTEAFYWHYYMKALWDFVGGCTCNI